MVAVSLLLLAASPLAQLTDWVTSVATPGIPGIVHALSPASVPFLVGKAGKELRPVAVAGNLGKGRVVAFGHDGYLSEGALDTGDGLRLMRNVIRWTSGKDDPRVGYDSVQPEFIRKLGFEEVKLQGDGWSKVDVVVAPLCPDPAKVRAVLKRGGGAVAAMTPWGWSMLNPGKPLWRDLNWNPILSDAGMVMADGMVGEVRPVKDETESVAINASVALDRRDTASLGMVAEAIRAISPRHPLRKQAERLTAKVAKASPTEKSPFGKDKPLERLALVLRHLRQQEGNGAPVDPSSVDFPGTVATSERVTQEVVVRTDTAHWQSTGLYAAPGEKVTLTVPKSAAGKGMRLQIGVHTDENWHLDSWTRHPSIVVSKPISTEKTTLSSAFGGLVILATDRKLDLPQVVAKVENAVPAPRFVLGSTTAEQWARERQKPAPWAEFESKSLILSVPSDAARKVDDPKALMELWDRTMDVFTQVDGLTFDRPERIVADRQISAGYMHSGYPIMTWLDDSVPLSLSVDRLTTQGTWGHWHELGHNRQRGAWTFDGTGEVTNNLFTLLAMDKIAGRNVWDRIGKDKDSKVKAYLEKGSPFQQWQSDPFLALTMYAQLVDEFGWEALTKVFKSYAPGEGDNWPEERKRDEWMLRYSQTIGRNLGPFFQEWGVPTSAAARAKLEALPVWMPKDWPKT